MWHLLLTSLILLVGGALLVPCSLLGLHADVYCGAWPEWAVSVNVFSLTAGVFFVSSL